ncbi:CHAT domain-containing protein, partial [Leptolyngbya sp. FACHB-36]|uniref:CHAT domain-containing protein n=1 Tax=Leptolyngbya sp. FACHB-36 TaxID=2692808 RepID=UPI00168037BC
QLVQQGIDRYHTGDFQGAIDRWQQSLSLYRTDRTTTTQPIEVWKYLARAKQQLGQIDQAIDHLEQAIIQYRQAGNWLQVGRMQTEQAQAYSDLGHYRRASALLCGGLNDRVCAQNSALEIARRQSDLLGQAAALGSLGNIYYLQGEFDQALERLRESQTIAEQIGEVNYLIATWNSLGNLYTSLAQRNDRYAQFAKQAGDQQSTERFRQRVDRDNRTAIAAFEASLALARRQTDHQAELRALLGLALPYSRDQATSIKLEPLFQQVRSALELLPNSREKASSLIKLASLIDQTRFDTTLPISNYACAVEPPPQTITLLRQAIAIAKTIHDRKTESFGLGLLGHVFECAKNYAQASNFTTQAQLVAATEETRYLWEWQAGRILRAQGKDAIAAYEQAVSTVSQIQEDIAAANRDLRSDFQATVEVLYRQLAEIRLKQADRATASDQQTQLNLALGTLDQLRVVELQNYLGSQCELPLVEQSVTAVDAHTAVFRSILLDDRIAIILTLPSGVGKSDVRVHWVPIEKATAVERINDFRQRLEQRADRENTFQAGAKELYDWFIRPFADQLEQRSIKALVFIQDGMLRSIPMAALYDGQQFLIQKYAIANTSSLRLLHPQPLDNQQLQVLAFGLTTASAIDDNTFFAPLIAVRSEIDRIQTTIPGSEGLIDQNFTRQRLQQELQKKRRPVLHLATHARFGFDAKETFLVTGGTANGNQSSARRYNEILSMNDLYQTIRQTRTDRPWLELLALTGCETAVGSDRDALGIAGVAVQAGAQSAIAALWRVEDEATATLIGQFYQHLRTGLSKAEALQATQTAWLAANPSGRYSHPGYWAPFILIGSWL